MRILVTGAASFIGVPIIRRLLELGHHIYAVVRPGSVHLDRLPEDRTVPGTLIVLPVLLEEMDRIREWIPSGCDACLHFGWDGAGSGNRTNREVQQKNVSDSLQVLRGAASLGCRRFLFSGSQAEYGIHQEAMTEDILCSPVSEYGRAKAEFKNQAQALCRRWREERSADMEYVHTRIFSIYGPGDHPWSLAESCLDAFLGGREIKLGECTQQWNFLHISDLVEALLALLFCETPLDAETEAVFNVAGDSGETRRLREYVEIMYQVCGSRGSYVFGQRPQNAEGPANLIPDIKKICRVTGWKPVTAFEEGIRNMVEKRTACILCGGALTGEPLLKLEDMPASAQNIPDENQVGEDRGITLWLRQCPVCGLVQFDCGPVDYYRDVIRSGGFSTTMVELRKRQYSHFIEACGLEEKKIIEVGCGQGEFLSVLAGFPVAACGIEHREDLVEIAAKAGLKVWKGFTESEAMALDGPFCHPPYDAFVSFNFLEHQPDPVTMLRCIYHNLADGGTGLITVPSLEYILQYDGYYELIRDHLAYYTFDTLKALLNLCGFQVLEEELVNRDTLSVIVKKIPDFVFRKDNAVPETACIPVDAAGLRDSRRIITGEVDSLVARLHSQGKTLAVWGASHQGFTLAATTKLGGKVSYIIDSAPFKQGRFAPASHLPVVSPDYGASHPVDAILIVAPGYTDEISGIIRQRFGPDVEVLTLRSNHIERL